MNKLIKKYQSMPRAVRASFWFLICSFMQKGISVITTPIFSRLMVPAEWGDFSTFNSYLGIVTIFVNMHLYHGVYGQGLVKFEEDRAHFSSSLQGLSLTLTLVWTVIYLLFHDFFNQLMRLTTVQMLCMLVMIWATAAFSFWAVEKRVTLDYRQLVIATAVASVAKPVVGIVFVVLSKDKVTARILGLTLVELVVYSGFFFVQMKRGKKFFSARYWKYALLFNIPLIPHYLSQTVLSQSDRIMIRDMVGSAESGYYSLAYSISQIMVLFNTALIQTISPWIYRKIKARQVNGIANVAYISLIMVAGVNLLLIALAPEAVAIFAPKSYHDSIWVIPPVAMSVFFMYSYGLFSTFEFYFEKNKFIMTASVLGAALNVLLNYIFIQIFGYYAAGYTTLFCYMVYALDHYYFMRKICRDEMNNVQVYDPQKLLLISGVFLAASFLLLFTYRYWYLRYACVAAMLAFVFIKRKLIISQVKGMLALRKKKEDPLPDEAAQPAEAE